MEAAALLGPPPLFSALSRPSPAHFSQSFLLRHRAFRVRAADSDKGSSDGQTTAAQIPLRDSVEIRFRRGSRRRRQQRQLEEDGKAIIRAEPAAAAPPKKWEDMSLNEKALELYMGEKGVLFWLNKFAYASIFIVIGAWILFRFVGPSLNLYQLDTPPLAPTSMLKG